jgi:hypothetical protein
VALGMLIYWPSASKLSNDSQKEMHYRYLKNHAVQQLQRDATNHEHYNLRIQDHINLQIVLQMKPAIHKQKCCNNKNCPNSVAFQWSNSEKFLSLQANSIGTNGESSTNFSGTKAIILEGNLLAVILFTNWSFHKEVGYSPYYTKVH